MAVAGLRATGAGPSSLVNLSAGTGTGRAGGAQAAPVATATANP